jgi:hypothetical protein
VPALADLGLAQPPVAFGARLALRGEPGTARDVDDLGPAGVPVDPTHRERMHADAGMLGQVAKDVTAERLGHAIGP